MVPYFSFNFSLAVIISKFTLFILEFLDSYRHSRRFGHLLHNLDLVWLDPQAFAEAIFEKGSPLRDCWGFIDGTARPICRPIRNQKIMFSGHKRTHCVKFQVCQS